MKEITEKQITKAGQSISPVVEPTEGALRATGVGSTTGGRSIVKNCSPPDPEVTEKKPRRRFTAKYKLQILEEAETCTELGETGALLRREGIYSSNLATWKKQKTQGILNAMGPKKRGRKTKEQNPLAAEVARLQQENRKIQNRLKQAELIIEAQKKISEILGMIQNTDESERISL